MKTYVVVRTKFEAIHNWPNCNIPEVSYLRNPHRHEFHIELRFKVYHNDRDIEFIDMKERINKWIRENWECRNLGAMSCEMIAEKLIEVFNCISASVFEDDENGAEVYVE